MTTLTTSNTPWYTFTHPIVRQLAWALASHSLIKQCALDAVETPFECELPTDEFWREHYLNYLPRLLTLDQSPEPLEQYLALLHSQRLGLRFEALLAFWLLDEAYHPYKIIAQHLQRKQGSVTIGEVDFLLLNTQSNQIEHWEVAIKFYLLDEFESSDHLYVWRGLLASDTLGKKLTHMCQHQFFTEEITVAGQRYTINKRVLLIKGHLFMPLDRMDETLPNWAVEPEKTPRYMYANQTQLSEWINKHNYQLQIANYHEWICFEGQPPQFMVVERDVKSIVKVN